MRKTNPTLYGFKFLIGDCSYLDYGAKWFRVVPDTREYHIIELINWDDTVGEREAKEIGETYNLSLSIVDLDAISVETRQSALESCGVSLDTDGMTDEWQAEACHGYGACAPISDVNTSNFHKTFKDLARQSRAISKDTELRQSVMEKPVNRIGSTADECMRGDFQSALVRGLQKGDTAARVLGKMHGLTDADMDEVKDNA